MIKVLDLALLRRKILREPIICRGDIHGVDPSSSRSRNRLFCTSSAIQIILGIFLDTWEIHLIVVGLFLGVEIPPRTILVSKGCSVPKLTRFLSIIFHFLLTVE